MEKINTIGSIICNGEFSHFYENKREEGCQGVVISQNSIPNTYLQTLANALNYPIYCIVWEGNENR